MKPLVQKIRNPEIFIGLVSPIGVENDDVINSFADYSRQAKYDVINIKITESFAELGKLTSPTHDLTTDDVFKKYDAKIKFGNQLRRETQDNSILAATAIQQITGARFQNRSSTSKFRKRVFILHQFKRPEEIELLRTVYGRLFFQISIYSRRSARIENLSRKFERSWKDSNSVGTRSKAEKLVEIDENERKKKFGQRVGKIFHDADLIVNADVSHEEIAAQVHRFCELLFGSNSITPTKIEYGMFAAHAAALRTSDLSRQVGAAIFTRNGEIVATGSNEVPKAGGGTYWSDEEFDDRDYKRRFDSNDERKRELLDEVLSVLRKDFSTLKQKEKRKIRNTAFMDALEYGRIIHAEMSALTDSARIGSNTKNCVLFATTFPCHMCAKHIVSAGIDEVIFLEPYPKSLAARLHSDSIDVEDAERGQYSRYPAVKFTHFHGVTPRRYREFFQHGRRKDYNGVFQEYKNNEHKPIIETIYAAHSRNEKRVLRSLQRALRRALK